MTQFVFTELLGGRVLRIDDLDESSLESVGDTVLAGPSGPSRQREVGCPRRRPRPARGRAGRAGRGVDAVRHAGQRRRRVHPPRRDRLPRLRPAGRPGLGQWPARLHRRHLRLGLGDVRTPWAGSLRRRLCRPPWGGRRHRRPDLGQRPGRQPADPASMRRTAAAGSEIALPAGANPPLPYGLAAHQDGVAVIDVGNARLLVLDDTGATVGHGRPGRRHLGLTSLRHLVWATTSWSPTWWPTSCASSSPTGPGTRSPPVCAAAHPTCSTHSSTRWEASAHE